MGFALIWHIWWLVVVAFVGAWAVFVVERLVAASLRCRWRDQSGLAVVQQIVLAHGWEIACLPNQPSGAIFRITHIQASVKS